MPIVWWVCWGVRGLFLCMLCEWPLEGVESWEYLSSKIVCSGGMGVLG